MKKSPSVIRSFVCCLLLGGGAIERAPAQSTAFTYQGTLSANSLPVNGTNDLTFTLFDAATGGAMVGASNVVAGLIITNGLFTQVLDFGSGAFDGSARWLELGVRLGGSADSYTALAPRQLITATPYALTAGNLTGPVPDNSLTGTYGNGLILSNPTNLITGVFSGDGSGLIALNAANVTSGRFGDARLSTNVALLNARQTFTSTNVFTTTNASSPITITNATDNPVALDFRQRYYRWRVGQNRPTDSPTTTDAFFIIGDDLGLSPHTRLLIDTAGRVGIGTFTPASRLDVAGTATIEGDLVAQRLNAGETNSLSSIDASITGGRFNTLQTNADTSVISGGEWNSILTNAHHASLAGGQSNTVLGFYATIPGGQLNQATNNAFAAGRRALALHPGAFVWADSQDADFSSTGANQFDVRAGGGVRFVTGGGGFTLDGQNVLAGVVPASALAGSYSNALALNNSGNTFVGSFTGNGAGVTNLSAANLASGTVPGARLSGGYSNALIFPNAANTFVGSFTGNGAGLTNLNVSGGGTNAALLNANQTFSGANMFTNPANGFVGSLAGSGAGVTNLNAANLASGTVPGARLSGNYSNALTFPNAANTFVGSFSGNGAGLTNLNVSGGGTNAALLNADQAFSGANTFTNPANVFVGGFTGNAAGLTNFNVPGLATNTALVNANQTFSGANTFTNPANLFVGSLAGSGAGVTNLNAANLASGTLPSAQLSGVYSGALTFNNAANRFTGNGSGLTTLNASSLSSGTVVDARLSPNIPLLNAAQAFVGVNIFTNSANTFVGHFTGDGAGLTNLNVGNLSSNVALLNVTQTFAGTNTFSSPDNSFTGDGAGLTGLNATNLSSGTVADARLSANVALRAASQTFSGTNAFTNAANTFVGSHRGDGASVTNLSAANLASGVVPSARLSGTYSSALTLSSPANTFVGGFTGNGAGLTNLNVPNVPTGVALLNTNQTFTGVNTFVNPANSFAGSHAGNGAGLTNLDAANLAGGTVPSAQLAGVYAGALTLNNAANRFTGNGAALTALNASNLGSGTVPDARLSTNVAFLVASQTFAGTNLFPNAANLFIGSFTGNGAGLTNLNVPSVPASVALLNTNQTFTGVNTFSNPANSFAGTYTGDGGGLANLAAANLSSGTVPGARLSGTYPNPLTLNNAANLFAGSFTGNGAGLTNLNVPSVPVGLALLNTNQTFTGVNTFSNAANSFLGSHMGDGGGLTNLNAANLTGGALPSAQLAGTYSGAVTFNNSANRFTGNGAALTGLNAASLSSGIVADIRLSTNVALLAASQTFTGTNLFTNAANSFVGSFTGSSLRTPDNSPLELWVNGALALRLEPTAGGSPNVLGGAANGVIVPGTVGAAIGGGTSNSIGGQMPVVGGGAGNTANGFYATIPGGVGNGATNFAFAAGRRAQAVHDGAFVWGDATDADLASTNANSVTFRAGGGYRFFSSSNATAGVSLAPDGTSWGTISDRDAKKNFEPVDVRAVLEKLALVPVQQWNYKWESDGAVPHLGPMAQDFKRAFYPGRDDKVITTQEIDGVTLAAIQGMNQKVEEQAGALRRRDAEIQELKQTVAELKELVAALSHKSDSGSR